ncbi:MAG: Serine/threonine-protein kinase PrkC [Planctomycetota bacterium]
MPPDDDRRQRVEQLVADYLARRERGELISSEQVLSQHADLMPELSQELDRRMAALKPAEIAKATETRAMVPAELAGEVKDTQGFLSVRHASRPLKIRCPLCRQAFEIPADGELNAQECPACHKRFSLAGFEPQAASNRGMATIGHFELLERIGMGGFGTVWKARDKELDRIVALKIPRQGQLAPEDVDNFLHEARIAAQLQHPNIVRVFEIGSEHDHVYIVSEFMEGRSLATWAAENRPSHQEVAELMAVVSRALDYAHQRGVIHRDLKPGNILLDGESQPHITDFGLARREIGDVTVTMDGQVLGTPAYMSPEQAQGMHSVTDRRSDIYSLGAMTFQLLTGELPFRGNIQMLIHQAVHVEAPRLRSLNPMIHPDLETICSKCLEKEPSRRYQTAAELGAEFERFCRGEPIEARPVNVLQRAWRWCVRNPSIPVMYATLALILLAVYVGGWIWFRAAYRETDQALTRRSLTALNFAADSVARTAARELEERMLLVEKLAVAPQLRRALADLESNPDLVRTVNELNDPQLAVERRDVLREEMLTFPAIENVQKQLEFMAQSRNRVFGWFILQEHGLQVARMPFNSTVGQNYAWRAYFHGGEEDDADLNAYLASRRPRLDRTAISPSFLSQVTNRWVITISAPISDIVEDGNGQQRDRFLGVLGLMFELGHFADLPGGDSRTEFAVLADARHAGGSVILQHPLYEELLAKENSRLPDRFQEYRINASQWQSASLGGFEFQLDYRDPLADDAAGSDFRQRWLAVQVPIRLRDKHSGLSVIVQESYQHAIGNDLERLRYRIVLLSFCTLALVVVLVIPTWAIVLRSIRTTSS